jgi:Ca2+-binding RTX toxin-like protein
LQAIAEQAQINPAEAARDLAILQSLFNSSNIGEQLLQQQQQQTPNPNDRGDNTGPQNTGGGGSSTPTDIITVTVNTTTQQTGDGTTQTIVTDVQITQPDGTTTPVILNPDSTTPPPVVTPDTPPPTVVVDNIIIRGDGDDSIVGTAGNDDIYAGGGDDTVYAAAGNDDVFGEDGDDILIAGEGTGNDNYDGGEGSDWITFTSTSQGVVVDLEAGTATGAEIGSDTLVDIENVTGGDGNDSVTGTADVNILVGLGGADTIDGGGGADVILGGDGNDLILVRDGAGWTIDGGDGIDIIRLTGSFDIGDENEDDPFAQNVEILDLNADGANSVDLDADDMVEIGTDGVLRIVGGEGDTVNISDHFDGHPNGQWRVAGQGVEYVGEGANLTPVLFDKYEFVDVVDDVEVILGTVYVQEGVEANVDIVSNSEPNAADDVIGGGGDNLLIFTPWLSEAETAKAGLIAQGFSGEITIITDTGTLDATDLSQFGTILTWSDAQYGDPAHVGDILADFVDAGGGLVMATYSMSSPWWLQGRITSDGYAPLEPTSQLGTPSGAVVAETSSHPIFVGVDLPGLTGTFFTNQNFARPALDGTAILLATDGAGTNLIAQNAAGNIIAANLFPGFEQTTDTDFWTLFANMIENVAGSEISTDSPTTISEAKLLANDSDPDGHALTIVSVAATSALGAAVTFENGIITYDPTGIFGTLPEGETIVDHFTYTVSDGQGGFDTAEVAVTVVGSAVNQTPDTSDVTAEGSEDGTISLALAGTDPEDGSVTTFRITSLPENGKLFTLTQDVSASMVEVNLNDLVTLGSTQFFFKPDANWSGTTSFEYVAVDSDGAQDQTPATATIEVAAVADLVTATVFTDSGFDMSAIAHAVLEATLEENDSSHISLIYNGQWIEILGTDLTYAPNGEDVILAGGTLTGIQFRDAEDVEIFEATGFDISALAMQQAIDHYDNNDGDESEIEALFAAHTYNIIGGAGADVLVGGSFNDTIDGGGGADQMAGGDGNDLILVHDNTAWGVDGGSGVDILQLVGEFDILDGNDSLDGYDSLPGDNGPHVAGIEIVDLDEGTANEIDITAQDVAGMNQSSALGALRVLGGSTDVINLSDFYDWETEGSWDNVDDDVTFDDGYTDGVSFDRYVYADGTNFAEIFIQEGVIVHTEQLV